MERSRSLVHGLLLMALLALSLAPAEAQTQAQPIVTVTVLPPAYARIVAMLAGDLVRVVNPMPPNVDPHTYEPKPEDIDRAFRSDLIVVDAKGHLPFGDRLIDLARERGARIVVVIDEIKKRGWQPEITGKGVENIHIPLDANATVLMIDVVREEIVKVAREKGASAADVERLNARLAVASGIMKSMISAGAEIGKARAGNMSGVAAYSSKGVYVLRSIGIRAVDSLVEEHEEPSPAKIKELKSKGVKCILILEDADHYSKGVIEELKKNDINPVFISAREANRRGMAAALPIMAAEALRAGCENSVKVEVADHHDHDGESSMLTMGLAAYSLLATIALGVLLFRRIVK